MRDIEKLQMTKEINCADASKPQWILPELGVGFELTTSKSI